MAKAKAPAPPIDLTALQATYSLGSDEISLLKDLVSSDLQRSADAADLLFDVAIPLPILFDLLKTPSVLSRATILRVITLKSIYKDEGLHGFDIGRLESIAKHSPAEVQREITACLEYHAEAEAGVPIYQSLLKEDDETLAVHAAYTLAHFPGSADSSLPLVLKRIKAGGSEEALCNLVLSAAVMAHSINSDAPVTVLKKFLSDKMRPRLQRCAALGLQLLEKENISAAAAAVLLAGGDPEARGDWFLWNRGELIGLILRAWTRLPASYTDNILKAAAEPFLGYRAEDATALGVSLLKRYFPKPVPSKTPFSTLDENRKILLLILAQHEHGWDEPLREMLAHLGLPKRPTSLEWYIQGLDPETGYRL